MDVFGSMEIKLLLENNIFFTYIFLSPILVYIKNKIYFISFLFYILIYNNNNKF